MSGRGNDNRNSDRDRANAQALLVIQPPRLPMPIEAQQQHGLTAGRWQALVDAVYPSAKSVSGVMLALDYCHARKLDPFKRVVHVVPMWNSALGREVETVWPGIGEMRTTASRTGQWAGNDDCQFGRVKRQAFSATKSFAARGNNQPRSTSASCPEMEFPEWAQFTVYKIVGGIRCPFVGPKVRFTEIFSGQKGLRVPNERWQQAPYQMLEKCAEAAALRRAFPDELGDEWSADEMEGKDVPRSTAPEAQYHYVDETDATGGAEAPDQSINQAADGGDDQHQDDGDDLNGWEQKALDKYMKVMARFFANVQSIKEMDSAFERERADYESLPKIEREKADAMIEGARRRLAPAEGDQQQASDPKPEQGEHDEQQQADPPADQQSGDADGKDPQDTPFVRNLRLRIDEVEVIADLMKLESTEKRAIDNQPAWAARICTDLIEAKRRALKGE